MNTHLFCLFIMLSGLSHPTLGQTDEGTLALGGNGNFSIHASSTRERVVSATLAPNLFVFVKNKLAVGGSFELGLMRYLDNSYHSFGMFPTVRYYPGRSNPLRIFILGDFGYHLTRYTTQKVRKGKSGLGLGGRAGLAYFFNEKVSIEGLAKLRAFRYTNGTNSASLQLRIGVQLYLEPQRRW